MSHVTLFVTYMIIQRPLYLRKLINSRHNGMIKVVTGLRRCGKSFLLFTLYTEWLKTQGVDESHIIHVDLEDRRNEALRHPDALLAYIDQRIVDKAMYYVMVDEVQLVDEFEDVLNSYLKIKNVDVYATGSNARFLSKDIVTSFRGRSFEIRVYPLSFSEFLPASGLAKAEAFDEYRTYGGMPQILYIPDREGKMEYLSGLYAETYIRDIRERYNIKSEEDMDDLLNILSSDIGSLTNPTKLSNSFKSIKHVDISRTTICRYLEYICDSFLVEKSLRYDVKGKKFLDTPYKFYYTDLGLRNVRLNFRQMDHSHIMENIIYNELRIRGFNVDVGVVPVVVRESDGKQVRRSYEIDFVCNKGSEQFYIQSAYRMIDEEKIRQEEASLRNVRDSFRKIIVVAENIIPYKNDMGITTIGLYDFLLDPNSLLI